jgi:beta-glucosidase
MSLFGKSVLLKLSIVSIFFCSWILPVFSQDIPIYKKSSFPIEQRVRDLLSRMTLEEKVAQVTHLHANSLLVKGKLDKSKIKDMLSKDCGTGFVECFTYSGQDCLELMNSIQLHMRKNTRLGIPSFTVSESLHGSFQGGSTIFPQAIALGSTFNRRLAYEMTSAISEELNAQNIKQVLAPDIDVCRDLRWGRVEECIGEAPYMIAEIGLAEVRGYLDGHISPMLKHYGAHGTPQGGINLASVSCGERDLLSVYLYPFERIARETHVMAVMSSYDSWNRIPNSASRYLLTELLRNRWGFKGYVYSDWGAVNMLKSFHHTAQNDAEAGLQALTSGLDADASDRCFLELPSLISSNKLDIQYLDLAVSRILRAKFEMGMFDYKLPEKGSYNKYVHTSGHIDLARQIAEESVILMKNANGILPLDVESLNSVAIIGPNAAHVQFGDYSWCNDNAKGVTLLDAVKSMYGEKLAINYARGCDLSSDDHSGFIAAIEAAKKSDLSVVVVGSSASDSSALTGEGHDLSDLVLPGVQEELVEEIYKLGKPVVVVLLAGKPFAIPWIKGHIPGILVQWYPGEQGGTALAEILFGKVNPSGKLNFSFPQSVGHLPCFYDYLPSDKGYYHHPGSKGKVGWDYVFSDTKPLWAFGHGLSYTNFKYLSATTQKEDFGQKDTIRLSIDICNTGSCDGMEVPQVYIRDVVSSVATPVQELKGFEKVFIKKGETAHVSFSIPVSELALYNEKMERVVEPGAFELQIGSASDDIRINKTITVEKDRIAVIPSEGDDNVNQLNFVK